MVAHYPRLVKKKKQLRRAERGPSVGLHQTLRGIQTTIYIVYKVPKKAINKKKKNFDNFHYT